NMVGPPKTRDSSIRTDIDLHTDMINWIRKGHIWAQRQVKGCRLAVDGSNLDANLLEELNNRVTKVEQEQAIIRSKQCDILTNFKATLDFLTLVTQHLEDGKGKDKTKSENIKTIKNGLENAKKAFFKTLM
ncbi:hypothetical protein KI387_039987, partial [Taxus chinensis]